MTVLRAIQQGDDSKRRALSLFLGRLAVCASNDLNQRLGAVGHAVADDVQDAPQICAHDNLRADNDSVPRINHTKSGVAVLLANVLVHHGDVLDADAPQLFHELQDSVVQLSDLRALKHLAHAHQDAIVRAPVLLDDSDSCVVSLLPNHVRALEGKWKDADFDVLPASQP